MSADSRRDDALPQDAWSDIPDPLLAATKPAHAQAPDLGRAPTVASSSRAQTRVRRIAALGAAAVWPLIVFAWYGGSWRGSGVDFVAAQFAIWGVLLVVAAQFSLSSGARGLGKPVRWVRLLAIGAPLAFIALAFAWLPPHAKASAGFGPTAMLEGCAEIGLQVAAPMVILSAWAVRRSFPSGAVWRGALLGAACGLGGVMVLVLLCGSPFGGHIALAHGAPLVLSTLVGAVAGSKFSRA